jgi:hypothetical protein
MEKQTFHSSYLLTWQFYAIKNGIKNECYKFQNCPGTSLETMRVGRSFIPTQWIGE